MAAQAPKRPKVVIIGAGFGGLAAAQKLQDAPVDVTLVDKRNYHLFQPLLYQVATADLSPADVAWPIRGLFADEKNVRVALSEVQEIDLERRRVICDTADFDYDQLIIATGAQHSYFGNEQWEPHAPGLKRIVDATEIRKRILMAFERAEVAKDPEVQARELTFVVVGGGPTGVELAGSISELARRSLAKDFRNIDPTQTRVVLVEAGPRVLSTMPEELSEKALKSLEKLGVEVQLDTMVEDISEDGVQTSEGFIPAATKVWGAGVKVRKLGAWLGTETDRSGRIAVEEDLSLPGHPEVFVIGDAAKVAWTKDLDVPGIAPAAKQEGAYVGKRLARMAEGKKVSKRGFKYSHRGNLATIGRNAAVIDWGWLRLSGAPAWWIWGFAHVYFLIGVRRPVFVLLSWFWSYVTFSKGARLITGLRPLYLAADEKRLADEKRAAEERGKAA
ncbi:MAG: NAD(P)/FAD-dependent oxidoreductase [Pseudomonadota bacterium]